MNRLSLLGFVGLVASVLAGCPIYGNDTQSSAGCFGDACSTTSTSTGIPGTCRAPGDCGQNETCGQDGQCHPGDCSLWGCVAGFECDKNPDQTVSCVPVGGTGGAGGTSTTTTTTGTGGAGGTSTTTTTGVGGAGGSGTTTTTGVGGGPATVYCANAKDCGAGQTCAPNGTCQAGDCVAIGCIYGFVCGADGACKHANPADCGADADCAAAGQGYVCVSGTCTQPADQCFDQTQCLSGKCAAGKCTPSCSVNTPCDAANGFTCDQALGLCTTPAKSCTITNDCGGPSSVCVDGACVPRSNGPTCPMGDVWVQNGCIPNQSASFTCDKNPAVNNDGTQDLCMAGSLCLHHNCYIACDPAQNPNACSNLGNFNQCKSAVSSSGPHNVCGSSQNLGSECAPDKACAAGKICIDGFCK